MTLAHPKPVKREKPKRKRISRQTPVKKRSSKRPSVVKADQEWAAAVRLSNGAGMACEWCFKSARIGETFDAHHVYSKRAFPRLRYDTDNGVQLDRACHQRAHRNVAAFKAWFAARDPERWARLQAKAIREARLS